MASYLGSASYIENLSHNINITRKRFSEKNNSCVYKLHSIHTRFLFTKPVWSPVLT